MNTSNTDSRRTTDSYGAIVLRTSVSGSKEVLLIRCRSGWSFPKGHIEDGETPEATAIRETREETGVDITIDTGFCVQIPSARPGDRRTVTFFLGKCAQPNVLPCPSEEVGDARWIDCEEALQLIYYPPDLQSFKAALDYEERKNPVRNDSTTGG